MQRLHLTDNPIMPRLWKLAYPTMISFALQSFYDIVDMAWVGQISSEALSGVTLFTTIYTLFTVLNEIAGGGSVAMIAQSYGRGTHQRTQLIAEQTISFKIVLALIAGGLMLFLLDPVLHLYTQDAATIQAAKDYGLIRIYFLPMAFSSYSVNTIFRCTQDSKTPMKIMLLAGFLNLILDPLMMFSHVPGTPIPGLGLGVFGAALATAIATTISFIYGFTILITGRRDVTISLRGLLRLDLPIDRELMRIGAPAGLQLFVNQFFNATMMKFVTTYGVSAVALAGISGKLNGFLLMPIFGLNMAGSALVGSALGRDNIREAEQVSAAAVRINTVVVGSLGLVIALFARPVISIFSRDPEVISEGIIMIRVSVISLVLSAYNYGRKVVFSGSGYNRPQLIITFVSFWLVQIPSTALIVFAFHLPLSAFWWSMVIGTLADVALTAYYYGQSTWRMNRV